MRKSGLILFVALLLIACGGEEEKQQTLHKQVIEEEGFTVDTTCGVYRCYRGTIAGQPVMFHFIQYDWVTGGNYYYEKLGQNIGLYNTLDDTDGTVFNFVEDPTTQVYGERANWKVVVAGDSMKGEWISGDGKVTHPILLREDYTNGTQQFTVACMKDSLCLTDTPESPRADASYKVLLPVGDDENTRFVRTVVYNSMGCDTTAADGIKTCLDKLKKQYFDEYNGTVGTGKAGSGPAFFDRWEQQTDFWVLYNGNGLVVLNNRLYNYTGGAHGMYSGNYLCIDAANKTVWKLEDIMTPDTARLVTLMEKQARKLYGIKGDDPLGSQMLAENLYIPEQFYISHTGITFVFGVYEIASYADGEINLFIPYSAINDMLTPRFKQRMGLEAIAQQQ